MIIFLPGFIPVLVHTAAIMAYRPTYSVSAALSQFSRLWELLYYIPVLNL